VNFFSKAQLPDLLSERDGRYDLSLFVTGDSKRISAFVVCGLMESQLAELWEEINNRVAIDYQAGLSDDFSRWNVYLVFLVSGLISKQLRYTIENDKFALRKLMVFVPEVKVDDEFVIRLLNDEILGHDLVVDPVENALVPGQNYNSRIFDVLSEYESIPSDNKLESKELREKVIARLLGEVSL